MAIIAIFALFLVTACSVNNTSPDVNAFVFDWSDGACESDADCEAIEYGCGGGHIMCTNDTAKWKDVMSTCEIVEGHPSNEGYACSCSAKENRCGWAK